MKEHFYQSETISDEAIMELIQKSGIGQIYPPSVFKELHYAHHRHTHEPGLDPEISFGGKPIPSVISNPPMYLSWLTGFPLFFAKFLFTIVGVLRVPEFLRKALFPFIRPAVKGRIFVEAWVIFIIYAFFVYLAIYVNAGFWGLFVGQVVGHCILAVYLVPEHNGLPHEGTILEKTRSVNTTSIVKLIMWNMPYHALPDLNKVMAEDLIHNKEGHTAVHLKVMKHTVSGSEFEV
jgi:fatty acid desaturase